MSDINKTQNVSVKRFKKFLLGRKRNRGTFILTTSVIVIGIFIVFNLLIGQIPGTITQLDMSDDSIYEISDVSREYLKNLNEPIELILLSNDVDERILKFCNNYAELSKKITVSIVDPVEYPSFQAKYDAGNNVVVVINKNTGAFKTVEFAGDGGSMIVYAVDWEAMEKYENGFDGEGQLTAAIDYVTRSTIHKIYSLSGHGEVGIPDSAVAHIGKANIDIYDVNANDPNKDESIDLLIDGAIPEDCELLFILNPMTDLSDDELPIIRDYMQNGGKVMLMINNFGLTNFNSLLEEYGLLLQDGFVGDTTNYYSALASQYGYYCFNPKLAASHEITAGLSGNSMTYFSLGMLETIPARDSITTKVFMQTSEDGIITNNDGESIYGQFAIGAVATEETAGGTSRFTVLSTAHIIEDVFTAYPSMNNYDIFYNAVTTNFDDVSEFAIAEKSMAVNYNNIVGHTLLSLIFIIPIPVACIITGIVVWSHRRKR